MAKDQDVVVSRPSCSNRPCSEELSTVEVNSQIHKVMDLGINPNPKASPAPLQEGVASARVSTIGPISTAYMILSFHCARGLAQGLGVAVANYKMPTRPRMRQGER
jgi:hypothetical protein